jgi:molybdopterin-containing oxidoreductase family iron-sulfur binding subunit
MKTRIPDTPEPPVAPPRHWRTLDERLETPAARRAAQDEFLPGAVDISDLPAPSELSRRGFLGILGGAAALAATVACDRKAQGTIVPYTRRPLEVIPGVANYYASATQEGRRVYSVLVKTREGRPIHITGNDEHPGFKGKTSPRVVADILRLYDPERLRGPKADGHPIAWPEADRRLTAALADAKAAGKPVLLLTGAVASPSRRALLSDLKAALPTLEHLAWEPAIGDGALTGTRAVFGTDVVALPRLEQAKVILALASDFLDGEDPEAMAAFAAQRRLSAPGQPMNRLWVLEGALSLTGSNADERVPVRPTRLGAVAFALAKDLHTRHGLALPAGVDLSNIPGGVPPGVELPAATWNRLLADLASAGHGAVVLCGSGLSAEAHQATHLLNAMLGSRAQELRPADPLATLPELTAAVQGMADGRYAAAILWDVNPAYAFPVAQTWKDALAKVPCRAWIGLAEDETAAQCSFLLPEHHWLEGWNDYEDGALAMLQQPAIGALYDTRQGEDTLLALLRGLGAPAPGDYHTYLKARWQRVVYPVGSLVPFERYFEVALHDGLVQAGPAPAAPAFKGDGIAEAARQAFAAQADGMELFLHPGFATLDGRHAGNGWLQETPDPVTKMTWDNPLLLSVADAQRLHLRDGDEVELALGGTRLRLPVVLQPGQAAGVVSLALGYGRTTGEVATGKGVNAFPLVAAGTPAPFLRSGFRLNATGGSRTLSRTQAHHRLDGRDIVRTFSLAEYAQEARDHKEDAEPVSLYPDQRFPEHKWGMVIDLSACVGCAGCSVACQSENNIAVVGPEQVSKGREMHWIRLDTYYEGPVDNPTVVHQPMLCQQCDDAPCENVCPVNATNHSPEGLNQMVYNRCVGTRYCANNCPYKVRRFNFLDFMSDKTEPESLVYNPEVTVRPRGVMEKCTFCVQRIEDGKIRAMSEDRPLRDGEITPACVAACPAEAIVFGDLKDPRSQVSRLAASNRGFKVLEELGVKPAITYLADLKNPAFEGGRDAK